MKPRRRDASQRRVPITNTRLFPRPIYSYILGTIENNYAHHPPLDLVS